MNSLLLGIVVIGAVIAIWLRVRKKGDFTNPESLMKEYRVENQEPGCDESRGADCDDGEDEDGDDPYADYELASHWMQIYEIKVAADRLEKAGIRFTIVCEQDKSYSRYGHSGMGSQAYIIVHKDDLDKAAPIIAEVENIHP